MQYTSRHAASYNPTAASSLGNACCQDETLSLSLARAHKQASHTHTGMHLCHGEVAPLDGGVRVEAHTAEGAVAKLEDLPR